MKGTFHVFNPTNVNGKYFWFLLLIQWMNWFPWSSKNSCESFYLRPRNTHLHTHSHTRSHTYILQCCWIDAPDKISHWIYGTICGFASALFAAWIKSRHQPVDHDVRVNTAHCTAAACNTIHPEQHTHIHTHLTYLVCVEDLKCKEQHNSSSSCFVSLWVFVHRGDLV